MCRNLRKPLHFYPNYPFYAVRGHLWGQVSDTSADIDNHNSSGNIDTYNNHTLNYHNPISGTTAPHSSTTTTPLPLVTTTPLVTPHPAAFDAASLIINPSTVKPGENVNIYLRITNTGNVTGTYTVVLEINNLIVDSKDVTLDGGVSTIIIFTTSNQLTGKYAVGVAGLNGNFTVSKSVTLGPWLWLCVGGGIILGGIPAAGFVLLRNKKR